MPRDFSQNYDGSTDDKREMGDVAERHVADAIGGYVEPTGDGDDGGIDVVAPCGTTIDVKATDYETGHLLVRADRKHYHNTDAYALVVLTDDGPDIRGGLRADDVYAAEPRRWPKAHPNHIFEQSDLNPIEDVL